MAELTTTLPEQLFSVLQQGSFLLLNTLDCDTGSPAVNAISWVYAVNRGTIRFAVDQRSRIVDNVRRSPQVSLSYMGMGSVHAISGTARIKKSLGSM